MKKILVALMAVLVLISCGGDKKAEKKSAASYAAELTTLFEQTNDVICNTTDYQKVHEALSTLLAKEKEMAAKYPEARDELLLLSIDDVAEKFTEAASINIEYEKRRDRIWELEQYFSPDEYQSLVKISADLDF